MRWIHVGGTKKWERVFILGSFRLCTYKRRAGKLDVSRICHVKIANGFDVFVHFPRQVSLNLTWSPGYEKRYYAKGS